MARATTQRDDGSSSYSALIRRITLRILKGFLNSLGLQMSIAFTKAFARAQRFFNMTRGALVRCYKQSPRRYSKNHLADNQRFFKMTCVTRARSSTRLRTRTGSIGTHFTSPGSISVLRVHGVSHRTISGACQALHALPKVRKLDAFIQVDLRRASSLRVKSSSR